MEPSAPIAQARAASGEAITRVGACPLDPDLDVENPLRLERLPQAAGLRADSRIDETPNRKGSTR